MNLYSYQSHNITKTLLLMGAFFVMLMAIGWAVSYYFNDPGILYGFVGFSILMNLLSYFWSDKVALAIAGAKPVEKRDAPGLYRIIENLAIAAGIPTPKVYLAQDPQINAFATGRNPDHAAVAVTKGALEKLDENELTGVIAHELAHVKNRDILVSTVAVVLAGIISIVADFTLRMTFWGGGNRDDRGSRSAIGFAVGIVALFLAPLAATLIRLAISRSRESLADASGVLLTRYPDGLISALQKIRNDHTPLIHASTATSHLYIANPFKEDARRDSRTPWYVKMFMTHPPIEERINALKKLESRRQRISGKDKVV